MKRQIKIFIFLSMFVSALWAGTTGKIAGVAKDAATGEALIGVNVFLENTSNGAATDLDGYYAILNVAPGTYKLIASYVGYNDFVLENVLVNIDQTTEIDIELSSGAISGENIVVIAKRPPIQKDVAGSKTNLDAKAIKALPVATVGEAIGLQAGVTSGFGIRGSGSGEVTFMVDGVAMRDNRTNAPLTAIPLSAVNAVSVQAGGMDAQYHNARSGVVNVVTKEGSKTDYEATLTLKAAAPQNKHFGISPYSANSYYNRPYLDPDVAFVGTENGPWDYYTARQYPKFDGWNAFANRTLIDDDPTNDLTPEGAKRIYEWQHRRTGEVDKPDYNIDFGFGGPLPYFSKDLGDLRFYASYYKKSNQYLFPVATKGKDDETYMLKLTSDITPTIKLSVTGIYQETHGTGSSRSGGTSYISSPSGQAGLINRVGVSGSWRLFTPGYFSIASRYNTIASANLTHVLDDRSFYKVQLKHIKTIYRTGPVGLRNTDKKYEIFNDYFIDEGPWGYWDTYVFGIDGLAMGGSIGNSRDSSIINTTSLKADYINQITKHHEIKTGFDFNISNYELNFGSVNKALPEGNFRSRFEQSPYMVTAYIQDKMEYEGMVATLGLIAEYRNLNGDWYDVGLYDAEFFTQNYDPEKENKYKSKTISSQITLSPRFAISHPISETAKLYFNYGHYRQVESAQSLYRVQRKGNNQVTLFGDPSLPMSKTISYEIGYDHAIAEDYHFHLAGYYKDILNELYWVKHIGAGESQSVSYSRLSNNRYRDIRGFEADITKHRGEWVTGRVNYEYRVGTSGWFGQSRKYLDKQEQLSWDSKNPKSQYKPVPIPRVKANIDFHTPREFGPKLMGFNPLEEWHFNFVGRWQAGDAMTWNPLKRSGVLNNLEWKDYHNVILKINKRFNFAGVEMNIFADFNNLFNNKHFSRVSFSDIHDFNDYMYSLQLPSSKLKVAGYNGISGNDQPGDVRKKGVAYQPMEWVANQDNIGSWRTRAIYFDASTNTYLGYNKENDAWEKVSNSRIKKIKDDKAYIDMPNHSYFTFLDPRQIFFGITLTYKL